MEPNIQTIRLIIQIKLNLPKDKFQYISLDWLYDYNSLNVIKTHVAAIIQHEKWTDKQNN